MTSLKGTVSIRQTGQERFRKLAPNGSIRVADQIETGKEGAVRILLSDGTVVNLFSDSRVLFSQYSLDPAHERRTAVIMIKTGAVRITSIKEFKHSSVITVATGQALAKMNRADLVVEVDQQRSVIASLSGGVGVGSSSKLIVGRVSLGDNLQTVVSNRLPPTVPVTIPAQQRRKYINNARSL